MIGSSKPISAAELALPLLAAAAIGLTAVEAARLTAGSLTWPLVHDGPLMHYVAQRIRAGAVPYRDVFDMNFPGVYLVHLLVVRVLGVGDLAWRLFDLGWLAATVMLLACFARPWVSACARSRCATTTAPAPCRRPTRCRYCRWPWG